MSLKVLLTTFELDSYSGLPLYTRDVALELKRQGHVPQVYTLKEGRVADELREAGILVTDNPSCVGFQPDIIHGQHRVSTLIAVNQFRKCPAIFINHNHTFWGDRAPFHPRIRRYFGVSRVCMERLRKDGVPENGVHFLQNFVDINRFPKRPPLPAKPHKALVFSNYANDHTHLPVIREACLQAGLELDAIGMFTNYVLKPESVLGNYDIVFAKAKAAIESMAVGSAVILCDFAGLGPMVREADFYNLRLMNFGFEALAKPLDAEQILAQIALYDPQEALTVRDLIRATNSLEVAVKELVTTYQAVINDFDKNHSLRTVKGTLLTFNEIFYWKRARFWACLTSTQKEYLKLLHEKDHAARETEYGSLREGFHSDQEFFLQELLQSIAMDEFQSLKMAFNGYIRKIKSAYGYLTSKFSNIVVKIWMSLSPYSRMKIKSRPGVGSFLKTLKRLLKLQ